MPSNRYLEKFLAIAALIAACQRHPSPPAAPPDREAIVARVQARIGVVAPGTKITRESPEVLALVFPDGTRASFLLSTADAMCGGKRPGECEGYVDKLIQLMRSEEGEEEEDEDEAEE